MVQAYRATPPTLEGSMFREQANPETRDNRTVLAVAVAVAVVPKAANLLRFNRTFPRSVRPLTMLIPHTTPQAQVLVAVAVAKAVRLAQVVSEAKVAVESSAFSPTITAPTVWCTIVAT